MRCDGMACDRYLSVFIINAYFIDSSKESFLFYLYLALILTLSFAFFIFDDITVSYRIRD